MIAARVLTTILVAAGGVVAAAEQPSLWERLGGEEVVKPMLRSVVDLHFDDPLTAPYFGPHKFDNNGQREYVKEQVLHFFSAGTGGPYSYSGKDMVKAHAKMKISAAAFHALSYHAISQMESFGAGGVAERDEVLGILYSLKDDVVNSDVTTTRSSPSSEGQLRGFDPVSLIHHTLTETIPRYLRSLPLPSTTAAVKELSLDDWYSLLPVLVLLFSPAIVVQFLRKVGQAHDLTTNNTGWFQWSSAFYSGEGLTSAAPYLLGLVPSALAIAGTLRGGSWTWIVAVVGYVLVPIVDLFLGEDSYNPTEKQEKALKDNVWFRVITLLYVPSYIATIAVGVYAVATRPDLTTSEFLGITFGVGIAGGFGIGCVHELIHRPSRLELGLGIVSTVFANYSHFWIEHLFGHHKRVATDEDPASSNIGDDLYTFWVKCIYKSIVSSLDIEARYLKRRGLSILSHRILRGYLASAAIAYGIYSYFGSAALAFYLGQGFLVALHIENANYIEHYGLRRRKVEGKFDRDGEPVYERPGWFHAWDTADRLTNWMLFKIQRHPDHHTNAGRPYQILRTFKESPTMPTGYAGMFVLSWFPPLFWAVMDPLVVRAYEQREAMELKGVAASSFPKGCNNISSFFKREGDGYFESGSSPYADGFAGGSDATTKKRSIWEENYDANYAAASKVGKVVESGKISQLAQKKKN